MMRFISPVLALVFLLAAGAVWTYVYLDIVASAALVATARDEVTALAARDAYAKSAAQFVAQTATEQAAVEAFIIPVDGTAEAIELIEAAGRDAKVDASVVSATVATLDVSAHERLDVSVTARGGFPAVARFGTMLEMLPRGATLKSARLESAEKGWLGTYTVSFVKKKAL